MRPINVVEQVIWENRPLQITWRDNSFIPPRQLTYQASGLCFTNDGNIVLVTSDKKLWQLVGGHPEENETIEDAFIREVNEEACATINAIHYLGSQEINDLQNPSGITTYYQARFYAKVSLGNFTSNHEIIERKCVKPSEVKSILNWQTTRILDILLQNALEYEKRFRIATTN